MPIMFNTLLTQEKIDPAQVRLLRNQDNRPNVLHPPYKLWRDNPEGFLQYQSVHTIKNRSRFQSPVWASFVADPFGRTLFVGLYNAKYIGLNQDDVRLSHSEEVAKAGNYDLYKLTKLDALADLEGRLYVDWGAGARAWAQRAELQNKVVVELRSQFFEEEFPGFSHFMKSLSELPTIPNSWIEVLSATKGVYLLTCPKTKSQYVGSAAGEEGFWGRWQAYIQTGHGGNVELSIGEPRDYRVSILETAGSQASREEIVMLEQLWKMKLQSREMGLNRN